MKSVTRWCPDSWSWLGQGDICANIFLVLRTKFWSMTQCAMWEMRKLLLLMCAFANVFDRCAQCTYFAAFYTCTLFFFLVFYCSSYVYTFYVGLQSNKVMLKTLSNIFFLPFVSITFYLAGQWMRAWYSGHHLQYKKN